MKSLVFYLKMVAFMLLFSFVIIGGIITLFLFSNFPQNYAKHWLQDYLKNTISINASFQSLRGNVYDSITIEDIQILNSKNKDSKTILSIKKAAISYNLIKFFFYNDKVKSINHVSLDGVNYFIIRDKSGKFRNLKLVSNQQKNSTFSGDIFITNFSLYYKDYRGWKTEPLLVPFQTKIESLSGKLTFNTTEKGLLELEGVFPSSQKPFLISGYLFPDKKDYIIKFNTPEISLDTWGPYVIAKEGFTNMSGTMALDGYITRKKYPTKRRMPIWYDISFSTTNGTIEIPYVKGRINTTQGTLRITEGIFDQTLFLSLRPYLSHKEAKNLASKFQKNGITNDLFCLTNQALENSKARQFHKKLFVQNQIEKALSNPGFLLSFDNFQGNIASMSGILNGTLNLQNKWLEFSIKGADIETSHFATLFPELDNLSLKKKADASIQIYGNLKNPTITGAISAKKIECFNYLLNDIQSDFKYYNNLFSFELKKAFFLNSSLAGNVTLAYNNDKPKLSTTFYLSNFSMKHFVSESVITGNMDASLSLSGRPEMLTGNLDFISNNTSILNQRFNSLQAPIAVNSSGITITSANFSFNESVHPLVMDLVISSTNMSINVTGNNIIFLDPFANQTKQSGFLSLTGNANFLIKNGKLPNYFPNDGVIISSIEAPYFNDKSFDYFFGKATFQNNDITVQKVSIIKDSSELQLSGILTSSLSASFKLYGTNFDLGTIGYTQGLPSTVFPLKATIQNASSDLNYSPSKGFSGKTYLNLENISLNTVSLDRITTHLSFSNDVVSLKSLNLFKNDSMLYSSGDFNFNNSSLNLTINPSSTVDLSLLNQFVIKNASLNGKALVSGNITYTKPYYSINTTLDAPALTVNDTSLSNTSISIIVSNDNLTINSIKSLVDNGSFEINGSINNINKSTMSYSLQTSFNKLPLSKLQDMSGIFQSSLRNQNTEGNVRLQDFQISSPYSQENSIVLSSTYSSLNELQFIESISSIEPTTDQNWNFIPKISNGSMSGSLLLSKRPNKFPKLTGALKLKHIETNMFTMDSGNIQFNPNNDNTSFILNFKNGSINQIDYKNSSVNGSISESYQLVINKNNVETNSHSINNILTGMIQLPHKQSTAPHPMDLNINLSNDNMTVLSLISKSLQSLNYEGELVLNIGGSLELPAINMLVNSNHSLSFQSPNSHFFVTSTPFSISDNIINFSNLLIKENNANSSNKKDIPTTSFNGTIALNSLNLTDFDTLITSVNILINDNKRLLDNNIIKGSVSLNNSSLSGTVITPLKQDNAHSLYEQKNLPLPIFKSTISLAESELFIPKTQTNLSIPLFLDLNINVGNDVIFSGPIFGNDFFGILADLEFRQTEIPLIVRGSASNISISNQLPIEEGSLTILNKNFDILTPSQQQLYANSGSIILNGVTMTNALSSNGTSLLTPLLSIKALHIIENDILATDNESLQYSHIIMTIDDSTSSIRNIYFDVFESNTSLPNSISELTFIKQYIISNESLSDASVISDSEVRELLQLLIPEIFIDESAPGFQTIGEAQINTIIRRSVLRPLEKNIAKQIGLNDLKINYNLGDRFFSGESTLGLEFIKTIFSDRLVLNLSTQMDFSEDQQSSQSNNMELSEIKLSYYLLKNKNLSLNLSRYRNQLDNNETYLSKFSMRYDHDY